MIDHMGISVTSFDQAKAFYDLALSSPQFQYQ